VTLVGVSTADGLHYCSVNAAVISIFQHFFSYQALAGKQDQISWYKANYSRLHSDLQADFIKGAGDKMALIFPPFLFGFGLYQMLEDFLAYRSLPHAQILV